MIFIGLALLFVIVAVLVALISLRLLIGNWLLAWLRGTSGLLFLGFAILLIFFAWDIHSYSPVKTADAVATIAFNKLDDKNYKVTLVDQLGNEQHYELNGDLWRIDIRMLAWDVALARLGAVAGYRFWRLEGRYITLGDEQKLPHTPVDLFSSSSFVDAWSSLKSVNRFFSPLEAAEFNSAYQPMADGALYSIGLTRVGVSVLPLNDSAKLAVENWQ